ncbi:MAG: hypothetical protein ABW221_02520 [Vicinamibacteria bacterium]
MHDRRLLGTWKSDRRRTMREVNARTDFSAKAKDFLGGVFGHLVLRYTRTRCHSTFRGAADWSSYRVVARDAYGLLLVSSHPDEREERLFHIHFEGEDTYWVSQGSFREFFRRIETPPRTVAPRPRQAKRRDR